MDGLMQDYPLTLPPVFDRAERLYGHKEIVTVTATGRVRASYAEWCAETRLVGGVLDDLGLAPDARVATFAWNTARHLSVYWAAPCTGRILHTLNVRLFADQLAYVVNHAEDEAIFVDRSLLPALAPLLPQFGTVRHVVVMDDGADCPIPDDPRIRDYAELLAAARPHRFGVDDERQAAAMCFTSGTTGHPRGVLYSHRSLYLHALTITTPQAMGLQERDRILPIVPLFHANAWGLAQAPLMVGCDLVLPGPDLTPPSIARLLAEERVTMTAGVPTIWLGLRPLLADHDLSSLREVMGGGSAVPQALSDAYRSALGIPISHAWGMTETSPVASFSRLSTAYDDRTPEEQAAVLARQGPGLVGVDYRIADPDTLEPLPWDDIATGELQVTGPWVARAYYRDEEGAASFTADGWFRTGDVAAVDQYGSIRLVDRTKDLVKSGGEWISSVALENHLMACPGVREAAVIAVPHSRWQERPLACVVLDAGSAVTAADLLDHLRPLVPKWWLPDKVVFIEEIPKTSVGKFSKRTLRDRFAGHRLPGDEPPD
jgi:fatty-acyl-CoA synthase